MGCLHGVGIVFGNTAPHNTQNLTETASALGATILTALEASKATYLVAGNVLRLPDGSDPYITSIQANPKLIVVSTEWLSACQAEEWKVPASSYLLSPFSGIKVSITNFGARERDAVVLQLKQGKANYSPELFRHTTHLVGNRPGGNKYTHAREWGLFIVHHDWVLDCLKVGHRLDERSYNIDTYTPRVTSAAPLASGGDHQRHPSRTVSSARGGMSCHSAGGDLAGGGAAGTSVPVRQASASIRGVVAPGPTDSVTGGAAAHSGGGAVLRPANGFPSSTAGDVNGSAHPKGFLKGTAGAAPSFAQPVHQYYHIPAVPPDDCYFLHWVRLWVVGCTSSEQSHVLAAVRESGATREPVLHAGVTHIVFGSVLSTADLAEVRQHLSEHREQVKLARLSWLYQCIERREYMEPEGPYAMTVAQLLLAQGGAGTEQLLPAQSGRLGHRGREGSPALAAGGAQTSLAGAASAATSMGAGRLVAPLDDYAPLDPEANNRTMDSISVRSASLGVFTGLWFTLAAVAGTEEEPAATKLVRQGGGMIMSASTEKNVRDPQRRYAVCPFSLPQAAVDRICNSRGRERGGLSEFERVPAEQRVTVAWLRACVSRGELLLVKRETPLFRPLPHTLPLPRFQGLTVAVSQYHLEQREVLEQLITRLGGTYTEKLNKRCDYLVIQDAKGEKFTHAIKWGIPCVRADWVLESAYAGRPLDDQLIAFLPGGITPEEMEERRAAASRTRGSGGCGPSQLGPTQRPLQLQGSQLPATISARGQHSTQCFTDGHQTAILPAGLPPRPSQASERNGAPMQVPLGAQAVAQPMSKANPAVPRLPMAPPPAPTAGAMLGALREASLASGATSAAAKPPSILKSILEAIQGDGTGETAEAGGAGALLTRGGGLEVSQGQLSGNLTRALSNPLHSGAGAQEPPPAPSAAGHASVAGTSGVGGTETGGPAREASAAVAGSLGLGTSSESAVDAGGGPTIHPPKAPPQLEPPLQPRERQAEAAARELDGATAMLMQFIDNNKFVPEMAFSQLDLPMQLPIPQAPPCAGEASVTAGGASSMSSREPGGSVLSLRTADGDGTGGAVGNRRSRKRVAPAAVGEPHGATGKVGGLPGRRSRNDDEEGFGVAMSQHVSYEYVAAAPPPRATRSTTRGGRGGGGPDAKENLIKAVQGNMR